MDIPQLSSSDLKKWFDEGKNIILLDVREDDEVAICSLPQAIHIPMNMIPLRQNELPDDIPIVVYCHHGIRSLYSAIYLKELGFDEVYNLSGGIDTWAKEIDVYMMRY